MNKMKKVCLRKQGFTLIELLVVIAVLAVLAAGVITAINPAKRIKQANDAKIRNDVGQIATAMQAYFTTNQSYPLTTAALVTSGDLKIVPLTSAGVAYTYAKTPATCTGNATIPCTEAAVSGVLNDYLVAGNVWCWRSSVGTAVETTVALCTAP